MGKSKLNGSHLHPGPTQSDTKRRKAFCQIMQCSTTQSKAKRNETSLAGCIPCFLFLLFVHVCSAFLLDMMSERAFISSSLFLLVPQPGDIASDEGQLDRELDYE